MQRIARRKPERRLIDELRGNAKMPAQNGNHREAFRQHFMELGKHGGPFVDTDLVRSLS